MSDRAKILKALAGTSWGQDEETMLLTVKAIIRSKTDFASPVWSANVKPSISHKIQRGQNAVLRVALGCHKMASEDHVHSEAKFMPHLEHSRMLSAQFLAGALQPNHPSHAVAVAHRGPRAMKKTLRSAHENDVAPFLVDGVIPIGAAAEAKKELHTA